MQNIFKDNAFTCICLQKVVIKDDPRYLSILEFIYRMWDSRFREYILQPSRRIKRKKKKNGKKQHFQLFFGKTINY